MLILRMDDAYEAYEDRGTYKAVASFSLQFHVRSVPLGLLQQPLRQTRFYNVEYMNE